MLNVLLQRKLHCRLEQGERLPREAFELDPQLRHKLEEDAKAKVEEVRRQLAWESERETIALKKLKAFFLDRVLVEHIKLHAFKAPISVSSFRTTELPEALQKAIEEVHTLIDQEDAQRKLAAAKADEVAQLAAQEKAVRAAMLHSEDGDDLRTQSR